LGIYLIHLAIRRDHVRLAFSREKVAFYDGIEWLNIAVDVSEAWMNVAYHSLMKFVPN